MTEDHQPQQNQPRQAPNKSIDGVKSAPRLSGENQQHHLQEAPADQPARQTQRQQAVDNVKPAPQPQAGQASQQPLQLPPLQTDDQLKQPPQDTTQTQEAGQSRQEPQENAVKPEPARSSFPYVAVTLAVIIGGGLIGLAVFLQLYGG